MRLLLVGRDDCHLCEQMAVELLTAFPQLADKVSAADVDSREDWQRRWGLKIPVLLDAADGDAVCTSVFDERAVRDWLAERLR